MFKILLLVSSLSSVAYSQETSTDKTQNTKTEHAKPTVHKTESVNTNNNNTNLNINVRHQTEPQNYTDKKEFCSSSKADCKKQCEDWLKNQKKVLKKARGYCSPGKDLYGTPSKEGCENVVCEGELKYRQ